MNLIAFCVRHAVPVLVGVILVLLFGGIAIVGIPRQLTPEVEVPVIGVTVRYLGAAPQEVESEIVDKIEEQLKAVDGVREMTSQCRDSMASIRLEFDWGTNLDVASIDVTNKLNVVEQLPDEADEPVLFFGEERGHPICFVALRGAGRSSDDLREYAEDVLAPYLKRIGGVSRVDVYGGRERHVEATFDPYQLAAYQLTPADMAAVLARENQNTRGGRVDEQKNRWVVRTVGQFQTAEDVGQVILRRPGLADVRMAELLRVRQDAYKDAEFYVRIDGEQGIVFAVQRKTGQNVVDIMREVYRVVGDLNQKMLGAQGLEMEVVYDESEYINASIDQLHENVFLCAALAGVVLVFFLRNWRAVLTIVAAIPISFVGTFIFLWLLGRTLNIISLAGLAFAVGMLVDNAIVVLENIYRHRQMGKSAAQAALDGAGEVWGAVLASTLTTVAVFVPIVFITEEAGQLFRDIALAIAISVVMSLAVSMTVIPMLSAKILKAGEALERAGRRGAWGWVLHYLMFGWVGPRFKALLVRLVDWTLARVWRRLAAMTLIMGLFGGLLLVAFLKTPATYLPTGNRNFVRGFVQTEAGASVDHNLAVAREIECRMLGPDGRQRLPGLERFFIVTLSDVIFFGAAAEDENRARELVTEMQMALGNTPGDFLPLTIRQAIWDQFGRFYQPPIAGVMTRAGQAGLFERRGFLGGQLVNVTLRGDSIDRLYEIAGAMMPRLGRMDGVEFIVPSFKVGDWELRPTVDRKRAADVGLTAADVGLTVLALVNGVKVADFREASGNELDLTLRADPRYRRHIERLADVPLWTPRRGTVALGQVAPLAPAAGFNVIEHTEQQRSVQLQCVVKDDYPIGQVMDAIGRDLLDPMRADGTIPEGYVADLRGTARDLDRMLRAVGWSLLLALVITYLLMSALFESFAHPVVIMLTVPLALVGGYGMLYGVTLWNLFVVGQPPPQLDVVTMLGFVILIGIVVNNAILVVAQALNFHRSEGLDIRRAIVASVESRIRPIFMSSLTSILGMTPLVLRPGPGSELYQGLGSVVVGGLLVSTVFTLILTPVVFSFGFRATDWLHALAQRLGLIVADEAPPPSA